MSWPARTSYLTPSDFYFVGSQVESKDDLVARIAVAVGCIAQTPGVFGNV